MPLYDYYCRSCNETFTKLRPLTAASDNSTCLEGHRAMKVITVPGAVAIADARGDEGGEEMAAPSGGGCACGRGACACGGLN